MAQLKQYAGFKRDLQGFVEVSFEEFRGELVPLSRTREPWADGRVVYVRLLADRGAGFALQRLFGPQHRAAAAVLGGAPLSPEPMARDELEAHMRRMVENHRRAGWSPERFRSFCEYLDGDAALEQGNGKVSARDRFTDMYRGAGPAFKRIVREFLLSA